jgi:hypothetical protein
MPVIENPLEKLDTDALKVALDAADTLMKFKAFLPRSGLLVMLTSRFRDDVREALRMEPERYATTTNTGRGHTFKSLDDLTSTELDNIAGAAGTLLEDRFTAVMDDPELPKLLREFQRDLNTQKTERAQLQASIGS